MMGTSHTNNRRPRIRRGHTLVETIIVMSLLAVIASMALPRIDYTAMRLDANVKVVRSALQQAWRMSVQKQHDVLVSFDTAGRRVRILEDMNNDGLVTSGERTTWRPLEEGAQFSVPPSGVSGTVTKSVSGSGVRTLGGFPTITFRRNGSTSGDAEVYLSTSRGSVTNYRGITLAQATGRTEWFRFVNSSWWRSGGI